MKDPYDREITNIRISLTQDCNLRCFYCHEEGETIDNDDDLSVDDIDKILRTAKELGMYKVKFSGGEPLVHPYIIEIIRTANKYMKDISLTTNGVFLAGKAYNLKQAGLDRVNVSLDTLDENRYEWITGSNKLIEVKKGIDKAVDVGLYPVKINTLLMKGINEDEIEELIKFSGERGVILQIIEMTSDVENITSDQYQKYHKSLDELVENLENGAEKIHRRKMHARRKYFLKEPNAEVELVRTMHNSEFCNNCTRLRVTSNAELKPCLLRTDNHVNIRDELNNGENLKGKFIDAINNREPYWSE
ncbi:MAG: GTP 3',8-cyclase MoaA [Thermoplasmatota archaeon]